MFPTSPHHKAICCGRYSQPRDRERVSSNTTSRKNQPCSFVFGLVGGGFLESLDFDPRKEENVPPTPSYEKKPKNLSLAVEMLGIPVVKPISLSCFCLSPVSSPDGAEGPLFHNSCPYPVPPPLHTPRPRGPRYVSCAPGRSSHIRGEFLTPRRQTCFSCQSTPS